MLNMMLLLLTDLTGGSAVFYLASYSYISDISEPKTRTRRIAFLDGVFPLGFYLGNSFSGIIKTRLGFSYNFGFGMLSAILAVLYCIFFVEDSHIKRDEMLEKQLAEEMHEVHSNHKTTTGIIMSYTKVRTFLNVLYIYIYI